MEAPKPEIGTDLAGLGKIGVQLIQTGERFLDKLFGPYLEEHGELLADRIRAKRLNLNIIAGMAAGHLGDRETATIPGRILFPLAEAASNEDSPELQAKWAALLANSATDPDSVLPAFPHVLKELSPIEARILDWLMDIVAERSSTEERSPHPSTSLADLTEQFSLDINTALLLCTNLERLTLIKMIYSSAGITHPNLFQILLSPFAMHLIRLCRPPVSTEL